MPLNYFFNWNTFILNSLETVIQKYPKFYRKTGERNEKHKNDLICKRQRQNGPRFSRVTYPLCLKPYTGHCLPRGTKQQQDQYILTYSCIKKRGGKEKKGAFVSATFYPNNISITNSTTRYLNNFWKKFIQKELCNRRKYH